MCQFVLDSHISKNSSSPRSLAGCPAWDIVNLSFCCLSDMLLCLLVAWMQPNTLDCCHHELPANVGPVQVCCYFLLSAVFPGCHLVSPKFQLASLADASYDSWQWVFYPILQKLGNHQSHWICPCGIHEYLIYILDHVSLCAECLTFRLTLFSV